MDLTRRSRWVGWVAAILVLAVVVAAAWSIGSALPAAEPTAITQPPVTVQYRMAQVKTATPRATATAIAVATPSARVTPTPAATLTLVPTLPAPPTSSALASLNQVPRIAVDTARTEVEMGRALFVDVRTAATYKQGHLPGAILLPGGVSNTGYSELPDDRLLIFYCA